MLKTYNCSCLLMFDCCIICFFCFDGISIFLLKMMNESTKMRLNFTWKKEKRGRMLEF